MNIHKIVAAKHHAGVQNGAELCWSQGAWTNTWMLKLTDRNK